MRYRRLGRTNWQASVLGMGAGYAWFTSMEEGVRIYERAIEAGVSYFDGRYGDSNLKLGRALRGRRQQCFIASKTRDTTREGVLARIAEDIRELGTDYLDLYQLKVHDYDLLRAYFAPGGSVEGLLRARQDGLVRFFGVTGHSQLEPLVEALRSGLFDTVGFPINFVQADALPILVPLARELDLGLIAMKPIATGLLPATLALKWLMNQPIACAIPGVTSLEQLETDIAVAGMADTTLSTAEEAEMERVMASLSGRFCRGCYSLCGPCPQGLIVSEIIAHSALGNQVRNLGVEPFLEAIRRDGAGEESLEYVGYLLSRVRKCNHCGDCQRRCPHGVQAIQLIEEAEARLERLLASLRRRLAVARVESSTGYMAQIDGGRDERARFPGD